MKKACKSLRTAASPNILMTDFDCFPPSTVHLVSLSCNCLHCVFQLVLQKGRRNTHIVISDMTNAGTHLRTNILESE